MINYIEYSFASNKGQTNQEDLIANPWQVGWEAGKNHADFTGAAVVESVTIEDISGTDFEVTPFWNPVQSVAKAIVTKADGTSMEYKIVEVGKEVKDESVSAEVAPDKRTFVLNFASGDTFFVDGSTVKYGYFYDNVVIPQNDLPMIKAEMKSIALVAKA